MKKNKTAGMFQFAQFGMIGLINAGVDIGSLNLFMLLWPTDNNHTLVLFNTISYTLAIINSYIWNSKLTFKQQANFNIREFVYFLIQAAVSLFINNAVFILGISVISHFAMPEWLIRNIAKGCAMISSSTASFFFMKYFVFRKSRLSKKTNA